MSMGGLELGLKGLGLCSVKKARARWLALEGSGKKARARRLGLEGSG